MPTGVRTFRADMGVVVQPVVKAGDVIFFMDGAQTHGTLPWQADHQRRSILFKYAGRTSARQGPAKAVASPEVYWDKEIVDGMTPEQLAVMYGPYSNFREELPVLTVDSDGTVQVNNKS